MIKHVDVAIIGSGPAGMAAAISAKNNGANRVLLLERDAYPGGILPQCIHNGFGLLYLKKDYTGPEYAEYFARILQGKDIEILLNTMVTDLTPQREIWATNKTFGFFKVAAKSIVLAMGCRERPRGALTISGSRPAGIFTAGTAQRLVNIEGYLPGKNAVILGSGDIGLIMARRLTLEGARVSAIVEILPYINGLIRNFVQCVDDFNIPLYLSHTVTEIIGNNRISAVKIARVDDQHQPILATEHLVECDTLLLSVGLIPENELSKKAGVKLSPVTGGPILNESMETNIPGIFACGNVSQVFDLVDHVTWTGELAGRSAAWLSSGHHITDTRRVALLPAGNVRYLAPEFISKHYLIREKIPVYLRVRQPARDVLLQVSDGRQVLIKKKLPVVLPGEMIYFELKPTLAEKLKHPDCLKVEVSSQNEKHEF